MQHLNQNPNPIIFNVEKITREGNDFRKVIYTNNSSQLAIMSLLPGQSIGMEIHKVDQFIRIEQGVGIADINGHQFQVSDGIAINVPAGNYHNITNTGNGYLKLYTIYSPPNEPAGLVQHVKM